MALPRRSASASPPNRPAACIADFPRSKPRGFMWAVFAGSERILGRGWRVCRNLLLTLQSNLIMDTVAANIDSLEVLLPPAEAAPVVVYPLLDTATVDGLPVVDFSAATDTVATTVERESWTCGLEPAVRHSAEANRSGLLAAIAFFCLVMVFNFKHLRRVCGHYIETLTRPRTGRTNLFDEHPASESRLTLLLLAQFGVCAGILLSEGLVHAYALQSATNLSMTAVVALMVGYVLLQAVVYSITGYTFGGRSAMRRWMASFSAVHSLMGAVAIIPMALAVFYPQAVGGVCTASAVLYLIGRIVFIFRGFKIFYDKFLSCFYFILYLCTLEIIPLFLVYKCALILTVKAL